MQKLTYTNPNGKEVIFDLSAPYIFWKTEGLSIPPVIPIYTQSSSQNGYTLHELLLESRIITITGHVIGENGVETMYRERKKLNAVCNPLAGVGTLTYANDVGEWKITAYCKSIPYLEKIRNTQTLSIEFECPSPYWLSVEQHIFSLAYVDGGIKFPVRTPSSFGTLGYRAIIDNDSDVEIPLEFMIDGGSLNPIIINQTTGEFIKLAKQVFDGEKLYINTDPEYLEVSLITIDPETNEKVKSNAYGYLTHDSTLIKLALGENQLTFQSDDENRKVRITISFYKRYVGV